MQAAHSAALEGAREGWAGQGGGMLCACGHLKTEACTEALHTAQAHAAHALALLRWQTLLHLSLTSVPGRPLVTSTQTLASIEGS